MNPNNLLLLEQLKGQACKKDALLKMVEQTLKTNGFEGHFSQDPKHQQAQGIAMAMLFNGELASALLPGACYQDFYNLVRRAHEAYAAKFTSQKNGNILYNIVADARCVQVVVPTNEDVAF